MSSSEARRYRIVICRGPDCGDKRGSAALHGAFADAARALDITARCDLDWHSCFGRCSQGPNVLVRLAPTRPDPLLAAPPTRGPGTALYSGVTAEIARSILQSHVISGIILADFVRPPEAQIQPAGTPVTPLGRKPANPGRNDPSGENGGESR